MPAGTLSLGASREMPLYCCDGCGWASTRLGVDVADGQEVRCPVCIGTMQLVFRQPSPSDRAAGPQRRAGPDRPVGRARRPEGNRLRNSGG
jgi:hypothetical protein